MVDPLIINPKQSLLNRRLATCRWIEQVVVALDLCPFAGSVLAGFEIDSQARPDDRLVIDCLTPKSQPPKNRPPKNQPLQSHTHDAHSEAAISQSKAQNNSDHELIAQHPAEPMPLQSCPEYSYEQTVEACLYTIIRYCEKLRASDALETVFLLLPDGFADFNDYLDFVMLAEALLAEQGYEGEFQLATFHPHYCFDGAEADDAANYTNRSPYPMVQLLRETSVEKAIAGYPDIEQIPQRNMQLTRQLGLSKMQQLLHDAEETAVVPAKSRAKRADA